MKAKFSIIMVRQQDHVALSNMPVEKEVHRNDGLVIDHFEESVKMSTYLVAFAVSDYVSLEATTKRGIKVRVWAPKDQISQARFAIHCAPLILEYFERFFNVKFPLPKQDLIAIPDFAAGAMENWGLITYRMTAILYDEKESSSLNKQWVAVVIAHELAHQWFGNLVTMKWWNDLWLNEGFASFVQYIGANLVDKGWRMNDQFLIDSLESSLVYDSHLNSHPISVKIEDPAQINEMFDSISYGKGASIIRMMQDFLGGDTFHTGLLNYLKKYQFSNAASEDLWKCMTEATGGKINVKQVMDTWTLQMGYPVINVARNRKGDGSAILTQEHFLTDSQDGSKTPKRKSPFNYKWDVPLTYYFQHHTEKQSQWFHTGNESIVIPWNRQYGWMKLNSDQKGFYRVNYDKENWRALSDQLMKNHEILSEADRANLIDDAFELGKAGYIDEVQALELTQYLENETAYVPFASALSSLGYIGGNLNLRPGYKFFEKYMLKQVSPLAKELGWEDKGSHLHKLLRASVLQKVVYHNDSESVKIARKMFSDWMINKTWIPPNLRSIIYFAGIKYGGEKEWNYMYNMYQHSPYPSEKEKLMYSLTMTADKRLLRRFLKWSLNPNIIRSQDACAVISAIAGNPSGTAMAIKFVKDNWHTIYTRFASGSFEAARLIKGTFGRLKSKKGLEETEKFFTTHPAGTGKLAVKQSIAQIRNHIEWLEKNERKVESWLENQTKRKRA